MRPLLAFLMNRHPIDDSGVWGDSSEQLAHAGIAIFLLGLVWVIGRLIFFPKAKQRSFYPYAAMLLGACAFIAAGILQEAS